VSVCGLAWAACGGRSQADAGGAIDSVVPRAVALTRFREGLPRVADLEGGAGSRDELVSRFVSALEARDTTALRRLVLSKPEFGYLYYPTTPQGLPPYELSPGLMWFMLSERGERGLYHALEERGGAPLGYLGYACEGEASREGPNTVWGPCLIRRSGLRGDTIAERLFGLIMERNGRFKFVSYANQLD
jgi:hypothetical protein